MFFACIGFTVKRRENILFCLEGYAFSRQILINAD